MARLCIHCGADISSRHYHARQCFDCYGKWAKRTGAAKATAAVNSAVRQGLLAHPSTCECADCGKPASDYDHRDYSQPLAVVPVCRSCNKLRGPAKPTATA